MGSLRSSLIRLAHENPAIRSHLIPIIKTADDYKDIEKEAKNPNTSKERLRELLREHMFVSDAIAANPNSPPDLLAELATYHDQLTNCNVASNPNTPEQSIRNLWKAIKDGDRGEFFSFLGGCIAKNPSTPPDILRDMATLSGSGTYGVSDKAISNPSLPKDIMNVIVDRNKFSEVLALASNPKITDKAIDLISKTENVRLLEVLVSNGGLSGEKLDYIARNSNTQNHSNVFYRGLLSNPNILEKTALYLAEKDGHKTAFYCTFPDVLELLSNNPDERVRFEVSKNKYTATKTLEKLMGDNSIYVAEKATARMYKINPELKSFKGEKEVYHKLLTPEQAEELVGMFDGLPDKREFSWSEINKGLGVPSLPGPVQKKLINLKNKSGRVSIGPLERIINELVGGEHQYDIYLESYSGMQTLHEGLPTTVLQLDISGPFKSRIESDRNSELIKKYIDHLTGDNSGHPINLGKTIAWVRVTDLPDEGTMVIEELQSDICNSKAMKQFIRDEEAPSNALDSLRGMVGEWEYCALRAARQYAEHKDYKTIYMVPGSVKSRYNDRENGYGSGDDSALKRIYDTIPEKVGFRKISGKEMPPWLKKVIHGDSEMWCIGTANMKLASKDLPEDPWRYFTRDSRTVLIPLKNLVSTRARPAGIASANDKMYMAYHGNGGKRKPISVSLVPGGKYLIEDGNSTYANAVSNDWDSIPAIVESPAKKASGIRYESLGDESDEEIISQLYDVFTAVGIRTHSLENPFEAAFDGEKVIGGSFVAGTMYDVSFSIAVLPEYQRRGIGKKLVESVIEEAEMIEATTVTADVVNTEAMKPLLTGMGFKPTQGRFMVLKLASARKVAMAYALASEWSGGSSEATKQYWKGLKPEDRFEWLVGFFGDSPGGKTFAASNEDVRSLQTVINSAGDKFGWKDTELFYRAVEEEMKEGYVPPPSSQLNLDEVLTKYVSNPTLGTTELSFLRNEIIKSHVAPGIKFLERIQSDFPDWTVGETIKFSVASFSAAEFTKGERAGAIGWKSTDKCVVRVENPKRGLTVSYAGRGLIDMQFDAGAERETLLTGNYVVSDIKDIVEPGTIPEYGYKIKVFVIREV